MSLKIKKRDTVTQKHQTTEQVLSEVVSDQKVRLNVEINKAKRQALKARAAIEGRTVHEIVNELVDRYLEEG